MLSATAVHEGRQCLMNTGPSFETETDRLAHCSSPKPISPHYQLIIDGGAFFVPDSSGGVFVLAPRALTVCAPLVSGTCVAGGGGCGEDVGSRPPVRTVLMMSTQTGARAELTHRSSGGRLVPLPRYQLSIL